MNVNYPDKTQKTAQCVLVGGVWVGTIEGSSATGSYTNGYTVLANGTDENGNPVSGYVLGRGDVEILKEDGTPIEDPTHFVTDDELDAAISSKAEISAVDDVANDLIDLSNSLSDYYTKSETSSLIEDCWKNTDITISAENGFTIGKFNNVSADESEGVYLGKGAGLIEHEEGGALMLETTRHTSQFIYDTAIITAKEI